MREMLPISSNPNPREREEIVYANAVRDIRLAILILNGEEPKSIAVMLMCEGMA